ncbi:hypothetical protein Taro_035526, partial [Colocasia esculenta]|nr:hypothetical protein [Colocasia esculenta]
LQVPTAEVRERVRVRAALRDGTGDGAVRGRAQVVGASNVSKLLHRMPVPRRGDAAENICFEAQAKLSDPVYCCVPTIIALQQQVASLHAELSVVQMHLLSSRVATDNVPRCSQKQQAQQQQHVVPSRPAYSTNSPTSGNDEKTSLQAILRVLLDGDAAAHELPRPYCGGETARPDGGNPLLFPVQMKAAGSASEASGCTVHKIIYTSASRKKKPCTSYVGMHMKAGGCGRAVGVLGEGVGRSGTAHPRPTARRVVGRPSRRCPPAQAAPTAQGAWGRSAGAAALPHLRDGKVGRAPRWAPHQCGGEAGRAPQWAPHQCGGGGGGCRSALAVAKKNFPKTLPSL